MPKKLKLNLSDLKIQSFITALTDDEKKMIKGAGSIDGCDSAPTAYETQCCTGCNCTGSVQTTCNSNQYPTCAQTQCTSADTCC